MAPKPTIDPIQATAEFVGLYPLIFFLCVCVGGGYLQLHDTLIQTERDYTAEKEH